MAYRVARANEYVYEERPYRESEPPRQAVDLTAAIGLQASRARLWRYPPRTRGRRHREHAQEEVFLVLRGTLTIMLGDPPERVVLPAESVVAIEPGTALQLRNETDEELVVFAYGAPPETGKAEILDDLDD
jgi:mannose-6-phosphate isomerase-like protein (cupin superfamily)